MPNDVDKEMIRAMAKANGLDIPENRVEIVLRQYESFLASLARVDAVHLNMAAEPDMLFTLVPQAAKTPADRKAR